MSARSTTTRFDGRVGQHVSTTLRSVAHQDRPPFRRLDDRLARDSPSNRRRVRPISTQRRTSRRRAMWGKWYGREREFYEACAQIALGLDARAVEQLGGAELATAVTAVKGMLRRLNERELPERLTIKPFEILSMGAEQTRIRAYSEFDPVDVPAELVPALAAFNGRPTAMVRAELSHKHGIDLDESLLRQLLDFEILGAAN